MHRYNLFGTPAKSRGFQMSKMATVLTNRGPVSMFHFLRRTACHKMCRRIIREYFRGIGSLHFIRPVSKLYHGQAANGEEFMNFPQKNYAGYWLLSRRTTGRIRVKTLIAQECSAFLDRNIITRHPAVMPSGPRMASCLVI